MGRNSVTEAIILKSTRFDEYHKRLSLLTYDAGIVDAVAYGAFKGKSKLSGITDSFVHIKAYLYFDPVKKRHKLSDAEAINTFDGLRSDLKRFFVAALFSELTLKTYAGGDEHKRLIPLFVQALSALHEANEVQCELVTIQFLLRFFEIIGYPPVIDICERCGRPIHPDEERFVTIAGTVHCRVCITSESAKLTAGALAYVNHTATLRLDAAMRVNLGNASRTELKTALVRIAQNITEAPLQSVRSGAEII